MKANEKLVGRAMKHKELGSVKVISALQDSRTKVEVEVTQRAKGWNSELRRYDPVISFKPNKNHKGETIGSTFTKRTFSDKNTGRGDRHYVHINELN